MLLQVLQFGGAAFLAVYGSMVARRAWRGTATLVPGTEGAGSAKPVLLACLASIMWFSTLGYGSRLLQPVFRSPAAWRVLDGGVACFMLSLAALLLARPIV